VIAREASEAESARLCAQFNAFIVRGRRLEQRLASEEHAWEAIETENTRLRADVIAHREATNAKNTESEKQIRALVADKAERLQRLTLEEHAHQISQAENVQSEEQVTRLNAEKAQLEQNLAFQVHTYHGIRVEADGRMETIRNECKQVEEEKDDMEARVKRCRSACGVSPGRSRDLDS
jgi:hypothetical protein